MFGNGHPIYGNFEFANNANVFGGNVYTPPTNIGLGYGYHVPETPKPYDYREHTDEIHDIEQLVIYIKKEFERLDARLDSIENSQETNIEEIKAEINKTKGDLEYKISTIYIPYRSR